MISIRPTLIPIVFLIGKSFDDSVFCVCQKVASGTMMQCDLCKDWFHSTCVQLPKIATLRARNSYGGAALRLGYKDCKYLCPLCFRTRRPKLESILSLLMSLQKLHTRLPEGEALQCLTERAMNWQDRARQLLQGTDLEIPLSKIAQRCREAAANQKAEKIIGIELKRTVNDVEIRDVTMTAINGDDQEENMSVSSEDEVMKEENTEENCRDEHAYSMQISKSEEPECAIHLPAHLRQQLEDLVMEGDLLEVTLEENQQLWQILQATREPDRDVCVFDVEVSRFIYFFFNKHYLVCKLDEEK